ncbi:MAG: YiiD C-terminal domain-containing protein [Pseudomonadales bacterium]|nr:YiiD C-terminal domain-containing protein [Pseudomonadales bacterium]
MCVDSARSLEAVYHELIPISVHMGIRVSSWDGALLVLNAPLANNINHQQSAFGGSLFSLAALAGWGLLQLKLSELNLDCNTVIAGGDVSYSLPVYEELNCECAVHDNWPEVISKLRKKGKGSLVLTSKITTGDGAAMSFTGN